MLLSSEFLDSDSTVTLLERSEIQRSLNLNVRPDPQNRCSSLHARGFPHEALSGFSYGVRCNSDQKSSKSRLRKELNTKPFRKFLYLLQIRRFSIPALFTIGQIHHGSKRWNEWIPGTYFQMWAIEFLLICDQMLGRSVQVSWATRGGGFVIKRQ